MSTVIPTSNDRGVTPGLLLLLIVWPVVVAGLATYWLRHEVQIRWAKEFTDRPRIVVIDPADFMRKQTRGSDQEKVEAALKEVDDTALKLSKAGYLVVERGAVLKAPENAWVRP